MTSYGTELEAILASSEIFDAIAAAVTEVCPGDAVVGGGFARTICWDRAHGHAERPDMLRDVDVVYYDGSDLGDRRELQLAAELRRRLPGISWDVKNQARVHLWFHEKFGFRVRPLVSLDDAIATFPETATAIGVRRDGPIRIIAPFGLDDLMGLRLRRNPRRVSSDLFRTRIETKRVRERWPMVTIIDDSGDPPEAMENTR